MQKTSTVKAYDGDTRVEIKIKVKTSRGLQPDEVQQLHRDAVREISAAIERLPYTDFGIENTEVRV